MSLVLRHPADPGRQLAEAVEAHVREAVTVLDDATSERVPIDPSVHDARRTLKRARALLRMAASDGGTARVADPVTPIARALRNAGRRLAGARDRAARVEALDRLLAAGMRPSDLLLEIRARLARREPPDPRPVMAAVAAALGVEAVHASALHLEDRGFDTFAAGLAVIHRRGRKALARIDPHRPAARACHRLRQRAKDLRHALGFLEPLWPPVLGAWHSETHRLTDELGEANDLTLVLAELEDEPFSAAAALLSEERSLRWSAALPLARRVWSATDRSFVAALRQLWIAWEADHGIGTMPLVGRPRAPRSS
jgi:CHAD domain-containing protein